MNQLTKPSDPTSGNQDRTQQRQNLFPSFSFSLQVPPEIRVISGTIIHAILPSGWKPILIRSLCFFLLIGCLSSCSVQEEQKVVIEEPEVPPRLAAAQAWADTLLKGMSVQEKIGQLFILKTPADARQKKDWDEFREYCDSLHIGGILLGDEATGLKRELAYTLQEGQKIPRWIGIKTDDKWAAARSYPTHLVLGAAGNPSLLGKWGKAVGAELRAVGAQLCFTPVAKVSPDTAILPNSLGGNPLDVAQRAVYFMQGLKSKGVFPCVQALPEPNDVGLSDSIAYPEFPIPYPMLISRDLHPVQELIETGLPAIQFPAVRIPGIATEPIPESEFIYRSVLGTGLGFNGLIFSPEFKPGDSLPQDLETAATWLQQGCDILVSPPSPNNLTGHLQHALKKKEWETGELDRKVRKVLIQKHLLGLNTFLVSHPDSVRDRSKSPWTAALAKEITENAFTVLKNDQRLLPLRGAETLDIASISIGSVSRSYFQRVMGHYMDVDHSVLSENAVAGVLAARLNVLKKYDRVLIGIHDLDRTGDTLRKEIAQFLRDLSKVTRTAIVNFGSPARLRGLDSLPVLVQANDNRRWTQESAGQLLFGAVESYGRMPVEIAPVFCQGDGLPCNKVFRFKYIQPEEVNISRKALAKVDSIIHSAMYLGVFPGCQVFAAKDGKVFYNKAFGHHSYDRKQPVRKDDVYDIASITKIAATTLCTMYGYDVDSLKLQGTLKEYIPEIDSAQFTIKDIRLDHLMIHRAGLPMSLPTYKYFTAMDSVDSVKKIFWKPQPDSIHSVKVLDNLYFNEQYLDSIWQKIRQIKLYNWGRYVYSDLSMFLVKKALEGKFEKRLDSLANELFYQPLGLRTTTFLPLKKYKRERIIPTEEDRFFRKDLVHGYVHDPNAALFGGIGGHAGLFSNAEDLGVLFQMLLNGGTYGGRRYFSERTVRLFTNRYPDSHRGLGFDMQSPGQDYVMCCKNASPLCFGHTGFTGTCAWADPTHNIVFIFLSNRVHPSARNQKINIYRIRQSVQEAIYDALGIRPEPVLCYTEEPCEDPLNPGWVDEDCSVLDSCGPEEPLPPVPDSILP